MKIYINKYCFNITRSIHVIYAFTISMVILCTAHATYISPTVYVVDYINNLSVQPIVDNGNEDTVLSDEHIRIKALSFLKENQFDEAWGYFKKLRHRDPSNFENRKIFILFTMLYCTNLDIEQNSKKLEMLKHGTEINGQTEIVFDEIKRIQTNLNNIIISDDPKYSVLLQVRSELHKRLSDITVECESLKDINTSLQYAEKFFKQRDYKKELEYLEKAKGYGWGGGEQLLQCKYFLQGQGLAKQRKYEEAEQILSNIIMTDRHYSLAINMKEDFKRLIFERDHKQKLKGALLKADWAYIKTIIKNILNNDIREMSLSFKSLVNSTNDMVTYRDKYLSAQQNIDLLKMVVNLRKVKDIIGDKIFKENAGNKNSKIQIWIDSEWKSLYVIVNDEIDILRKKANESWGVFTNNPVTNKQVQAWGEDDIDCEAIASQMKNLTVTYNNLLNAEKLSKEIHDEITISQLYFDVQLKISSLCKEIFRRAYTNEIDFQNYNLAKKLYQIIVIMPSFDKNNYPEMAKERLKSLQMNN